MRPDTGQIVRFQFAYPQHSRTTDSSKLRPCLVLDGGDDGYYMSPVTTFQPREDQMKYFVPLTTGMRRQLGLGSKEAWVDASHLNFAEHGHPGLASVQSPGGMPKWHQGTATKEFLSDVRRARSAASRDGKLGMVKASKDHMIPMPAPERTPPGTAGNNMARTSILRGIAARLTGERQSERQVPQKDTAPAKKTVDLSV